MQPTTLANVLEIAARYFSKDKTRDREFLVRKVNEGREYLWKDRASRELYFVRTGCECVVCMSEACGSGCFTTYPAIILPHGVTGVRLLKYRGKHLDITHETLPNSGCKSCACGCSMGEILPVPMQLKRPIPTGYKGGLMFRASSSDDVGKRVGVEYVRANGEIVREDVLLTQEGAFTSKSPRVLIELTLPDHCGTIDVLTQELYSLGSYEAGINAPNHQAIRLLGAAYGAQISWEALVEPLPVRFDSDRVEMSGELDWKNIFQLIELHFTQEKTAAQNAAYQSSVSMGRALSDADLRARQTVPVANLQPRTNKRSTRWIGMLQGKRTRP